jgi:trigger factor
MKSGESKTFPLSFPADYHGKEVAGKQSDFLVTLKKVEAANLPEVTDELAKSLGVAEATVAGLRADIKKNLEREVKFRLLGRNKQAALDAVATKAELDLPNASVQAELERMVEGARADLKSRGIKDADKAPIPDDIFRPQAEKRVRMGLVVADLVRANNLQATAEQIKAHIEELASSYEKPADVVRWYYSDMSRLGEVEAIVIENNVTDFILSKAKVNAKAISFDELMGQQG